MKSSNFFLSTYWKPLIREILSEPHKYGEIIGNIYSLAEDYKLVENNIISDDSFEELQRQLCLIEPAWALECIRHTQRCFRCENVFIGSDISEIRVRVEKKCVKEWACESCEDKVWKMGHLVLEGESSDLSDTESEQEENECEEEVEYLNNAELEDEIARGR